MFNRICTSLTTMPKRIATCLRDNRGSVSIEFAFIMPLLITLYLGTMEISQGIEVNKKVGRSAATVGDIIAAEHDWTKAKIQDVMKLGASQMLPYSRSKQTLTLVGIKIDASGNSTVDWSQQYDGTTFTTPYAKNAAIAVPVKLSIASTYLVQVSSKMEYLPMTSWTIQKNKGGGSYAAIDMKESYYYRPRQSDDSLPCSDC